MYPKGISNATMSQRGIERNFYLTKKFAVFHGFLSTRECLGESNVRVWGFIESDREVDEVHTRSTHFGCLDELEPGSRWIVLGLEYRYPRAICV